MLLVMLIHSVCGGGWLHAHECTCHDLGSVTTASNDPAHEESPLASEETCPHPEHPCHCRPAPCVYLGAPAVNVPPDWECLPGIEAPYMVYSPCAMEAYEGFLSEHRTEPITSGERCALLQVWRI